MGSSSPPAEWWIGLPSYTQVREDISDGEGKDDEVFGGDVEHSVTVLLSLKQLSSVYLMPLEMREALDWANEFNPWWIFIVQRKFSKV